MRKTIRVEAGDGYDFIIDDGLMSVAGGLVASVLKGDRITLFTDSTVDLLYADLLHAHLQVSGFKVCRFIYGAGERSKNIDTVAEALDFIDSL